VICANQEAARGAAAGRLGASLENLHGAKDAVRGAASAAPQLGTDLPLAPIVNALEVGRASDGRHEREGPQLPVKLDIAAANQLTGRPALQILNGPGPGDGALYSFDLALKIVECLGLIGRQIIAIGRRREDRTHFRRQLGAPIKKVSEIHLCAPLLGSAAFRRSGEKGAEVRAIP